MYLNYKLIDIIRFYTSYNLKFTLNAEGTPVICYVQCWEVWGMQGNQLLPEKYDFWPWDLTWKCTTSHRPRSFSRSHFQDVEELGTNAHQLASAKRGKTCISGQHIYKPCTSRWKENCWLNEETSTSCKEGKMLQSYSCDSDRSMLS